MPTPDDRAARVRAVAAGYDQAAAGYDARHGDARSRARDARLERPLIALCHGRVLELGCGTGRLLARLPRSIGLDPSAGMLALARDRGLAVVRGDAHQLPFAAAAFDAVIAAKGVFRYLDVESALAEAARVLAPGGGLGIHQFGARTLSLRRGRSGHPGELADLDQLLIPARSAGFTVESVGLWRTIRVPPYLAPIPRWIDRTSLQLWNHAVIVLRKPR